jgi:hypothetical protein
MVECYVYGWFVTVVTVDLFFWSRMMSDYKVEMVNDGMSEFYVEFHGPRDSKLTRHTSV